MENNYSNVVVYIFGINMLFSYKNLPYYTNFYILSLLKSNN